MKPFVLWMTGLPCSGKTTIVKDLQKDIPNLAMLDGDELREWFSPKDFSKAGVMNITKKCSFGKTFVKTWCSKCSISCFSIS